MKEKILKGSRLLHQDIVNDPYPIHDTCMKTLILEALENLPLDELKELVNYNISRSTKKENYYKISVEFKISNYDRF